MNNFKTMTERRFVCLYLSLVAVFNMALGIQGFDMCDEGWVLSGFQQIFNDPSSVQYLFLYYLSEFVGGVWYRITGGGGILAFRVLTVMCITASAYLAYRMLRPYIGRWCILVGMFWAFLCAYYGIMVFYHNYLTALLSIAASYLLLNALTTNNRRMIFFSGMLIGANVFVRLPNLSLTLLILTLIPYRMYNKSSKGTLTMAAHAISGFVSGAAIIVIMMYACGHTGIFVQAIEDGMSASGDADSTHNLTQMARVYLTGYVRVAIGALIAAGLPVIAITVVNKLHGRGKRTCVAATAAIAYLITLKLTYSNLFTLYSITTLCCAAMILLQREKKDSVYLSLIILINMYALPLGSDYGIENMGEYCIYLSGPVAAGCIWQFYLRLHNGNHAQGYMFALCAAVFFAVTLKRGVSDILSQCYFDEGCRLYKTCLIDNPRATTYTTETNRQMLNPMLHELKKYVNEDDCLLCFQNIPTVHFLTATRPYLYNPWVWTYDPTNMQRKFLRAEREHAALPVVVRDKSMLPRWYEPYPDWNNDKAEESYLHKNKKIFIINKFLEKHHYRLAWENEVFQILLPGKVMKRKFDEFK